MLATIVLASHCAYCYAGVFDASLACPDLVFSTGVIASISAPTKILQTINVTGFEKTRLPRTIINI